MQIWPACANMPSASDARSCVNGRIRVVQHDDRALAAQLQLHTFHALHTGMAAVPTFDAGCRRAGQCNAVGHLCGCNERCATLSPGMPVTTLMTPSGMPASVRNGRPVHREPSVVFLPTASAQRCCRQPAGRLTSLPLATTWRVIGCDHRNNAKRFTDKPSTCGQLPVIRERVAVKSARTSPAAVRSRSTVVADLAASLVKMVEPLSSINVSRKRASPFSRPQCRLP